ncbi:MAG: helix-turn-helix domain-containing protein [Deltaproteobacteria bacterium]|nr:helix-turn-helix domain-containing protein [Deltaproteobacteria bacterium]
MHHLVLDGTAEGALGVALDVFDAARRLASTTLRARAVASKVVSTDGRAVRAGNGRRLAVDGAFRSRALRRGDVILIAGLSATTEVAIERLLARDEVVSVVQSLARAGRRGVIVAASCSATFLLGAAGLLDGREATTTWWLADAFAKRFPRVRLSRHRMVVADRGVITAGAALAHADLALGLTARLVGASVAHDVGRYLVLDDRPSQSRYMVLEHLRSSDPVVRALEAHIEANLDATLSLEALARAMATSPRTLARRIAAAAGTTPQKLVQRVRMMRAAHWLETTDESVESVARRVGYADPAAFRRMLRAHTGRSPRELRRVR